MDGSLHPRSCLQRSLPPARGRPLGPRLERGYVMFRKGGELQTSHKVKGAGGAINSAGVVCRRWWRFD